MIKEKQNTDEGSELELRLCLMRRRKGKGEGGLMRRHGSGKGNRYDALQLDSKLAGGGVP